MKHNRLTLSAFVAAFVLLWQIKILSVFSEKYPNFTKVTAINSPIIIEQENLRILLDWKLVGKKRFGKLPDSKQKGDTYVVMLLIVRRIDFTPKDG
jgi:hypothetical protein